MNIKNGSFCGFTGSIHNDNGSYKMSADDKGNSILTGEGGKGAKFTCVELEVF